MIPLTQAEIEDARVRLMTPHDLETFNARLLAKGQDTFFKGKMTVRTFAEKDPVYAQPYNNYNSDRKVVFYDIGFCNRDGILLEVPSPLLKLAETGVSAPVVRIMLRDRNYLLYDDVLALVQDPALETKEATA